MLNFSMSLWHGVLLRWRKKEGSVDTRALTFPTVSTEEYVKEKDTKFWTGNTQSLCSVTSFKP